jgi:hypothetical protein
MQPASPTVRRSQHRIYSTEDSRIRTWDTGWRAASCNSRRSAYRQDSRRDSLSSANRLPLPNSCLCNTNRVLASRATQAGSGEKGSQPLHKLKLLRALYRAYLFWDSEAADLYAGCFGSVSAAISSPYSNVSETLALPVFRDLVHKRHSRFCLANLPPTERWHGAVSWLTMKCSPQGRNQL